MKHTHILATLPEGFVGQAPCACCLHVRFLRLFWRLNQADFGTFRQHIADLLTEKGFEQNEIEPGYALVMMHGQNMAALLSQAELAELDMLLEKASLELLRRDLQARHAAEHR
ncbi:MAG: hypothetical protein ACO1RX_17245 [Candidatus Sericytochromatia bacterium]